MSARALQAGPARFTLRTMALAAAMFALWLVPSVGQLDRYLGLRGVGLAAAISLLVFVLITHRQDQADDDGFLTRHGPVVLAILLDLAFAILFPVARAGLLGAGSDRADALDAPLAALLSGRSAYAAATYLGNPPTPLPGALWLALPFHLVGTSAFQNLLWAPLFALLSPAMVGSRRAAATFVATLVVLNPGAMQDLVTGGDYLVNALYVAIAMWCVICTLDDGDRPVQRYAATVFLAAAISSRAIYAVVAPIVAAFAFQTGGPRRGWRFVAWLAVCLLLIDGPIWLADPARFPLFQSVSKIRYFPRQMQLAVILPGLSLMTAFSAFLAPLTPRRLYGLVALSLAPLFLPILGYRLVTEGPSPAVLMSAGFCLPLTVFGGLWLAGEATKAKHRRFEDGLTVGEFSTESPP